jgi:HEAT repeat protein
MALRRAFLSWTRPLAAALPAGLGATLVDLHGQIEALGAPDPDPSAAAAALGAPWPGLRRAGARALGRLADPRARPLLEEALRTERQDEPRFAAALAALRCGAPADAAFAASHRPRRVATWSGLRELSTTCGFDRAAHEARWRALLGEPGETSLALGRRLRAALQRDPADRALFGLLAEQGESVDHAFFRQRFAAAGRRERHALVTALGQHGSLAGLPLLVDALQAVDVDPGFGFTARQQAGLALGRLGCPQARGPLRRALTDEALDHEGRPGAGLGIQRPVRASLLLALGSCGQPQAAAELAPYLGNTHGSALGGLCFPAMDALWRLGDPAPLHAWLGAEEIAAANAIGLIVALGDRQTGERLCADARPLVAQTARLALGQ